MNSVNLIGRPTRDPEVRYSSNGKDSTAIANVTLAVDNPFGKTDESAVDFIRLIAFGKTAEFIEKYITQGVRIGVTGRIQTGNYTNKEGFTVYTTDVVVSNVYFADSKKEQQAPANTKYSRPNKSR